MNGYNTGWKFDRWYDIDPITSGSTGVLTYDGLEVNRPAVAVQSPADGIRCGDATIAPIMTHGYNSIRLRFLSSANDTGTATNYQGIVAWEVYLVESDVEEDQTPSLYMITPLVCVAANVVYPSTSFVLSNFQGRTGTKFANQVRVVTSPLLAADANTSADTQSETYACTYMANALGMDVQSAPSTIAASTGAPAAEIINRKFRTPAFSPGFSSDGTATRGLPAQTPGELYINGLGGAARILVIPMNGFGRSEISHWSTLDPKGTNASVVRRKVAVMYNLIQ